MITRLRSKCRQLTATVVRINRGQTMVEYSLIVSAIAILVFAAYTATGNDINHLVSWGTVANDLLGS